MSMTLHDAPPSEPKSIPSPPRPRPLLAAFKVAAFLVVMVAILGGLLTVGTLPRIRQQAELHAGAVAVHNAAPRVHVVVPQRSEGATDMVLPGDVTAYQETNIHARTNGYLKRYLVDIGDRVKAGQLLAEIETPELDQELLRARATLEQANAQRILAIAKEDLARVTRNRNFALYNRGASPRQELDEMDAAMRVAAAAVKSAEADVTANEANVHRLEELQSFQKVEAPFDGVITARNVDRGALIDDSGSTRGRELFQIVQTKTLRVFVYVPQLEAPEIRIGQDAQLLVREFPGRPFVGKVARTAGAIDPASRTLLTEVHIKNDENVLYAGMYVKVRFKLARARQPMIIPATTLVVNADGTRVAVVLPEGTIHYQPIEIGRDLGQQVEVLSGLSGNESLVVNPVESLNEGRRVEVLREGPVEKTVALNQPKPAEATRVQLEK